MDLLDSHLSDVSQTPQHVGSGVPEASEEVNVNEEDEDEDETVAEIGAENAEAESRWEPIRKSEATAPLPVDPSAEINPGETVFRLRGGVEEALNQEPFIIEFGGCAGEAMSDAGEGEHERYVRQLGQTGNPYAPFSSRLKWQFAWWGKMCGPSSTALTELLMIDEVSPHFLTTKMNWTSP